MKIPAISSQTLSFGKLYEYEKANYTPKQEASAQKFRELLSLKNPYDKKGRSYLDHFEKVFKQDLSLEKSDKYDGIELYSINKLTGEKDFICIHKDDEPLEEQVLSNYLSCIEIDAREDLNTLVLYILVGLLAVASVVFSGKKNPTRSVDKAVNKMENIQNFANKANMNSIKFLDKFV